MTTATADFEPSSTLVWDIYQTVPVPDPIPEITVTGPVDGLWTVTAPDEVTLELLEEGIALQKNSNIQNQNLIALQEKMAEGISVNRDFLAITSPTVEENDTQIQALTRQINALLILRAGSLLDISGT